MLLFKSADMDRLVSVMTVRTDMSAIVSGLEDMFQL